DIAGLELSGELPLHAGPVRLISDNDIWNHAFTAIGFPTRYPDGVTAKGHIVSPQANGLALIKSNIEETGYVIQKGFSGGPVWDETLGGIVGMVRRAESDTTIGTGSMIRNANLLDSWPVLRNNIRPPCPYRGLKTFEAEHEELYYGRKEMVNKLVSRF